MAKYFTVRDKILTDVVHKIEKSGQKVFSLRSGAQIMIRGAGRFFTKDAEGKFIWRGREVVENFEKLATICLYLLTEKEVWKITTVDKRNPLKIDNLCKSWLLPHEIEAFELKQKEIQKLEEEKLEQIKLEKESQSKKTKKQDTDNEQAFLV